MRRIMGRKFKTALLLVVAMFCVMGLSACTQSLPLNPQYAYSTLEINLGEKIPMSVEEFVDFSELSADEQRFVKAHTEILLDGKKLEKEKKLSTGGHTIQLMYCGHQYRKYNIKVVDKIPPEFTKNDNLYTFVGLSVNEDSIGMMFDAKDNSGKCKITVDKHEVNVEKTGSYLITATAEDPSGNKSTARAKVVVQNPKYGAKGTYVYVSINNQHLTYFVDGEKALSTDVVTGNTWGHNTPKGTFRINNKGRNVTLKGEEDDGEEYESFVNYWMPFIGSEYGLHDATWRSYFGGQIYQGGGSHGCVNMPLSMAASLYEMIEIGTPVLIY